MEVEKIDIDDGNSYDIVETEDFSFYRRMKRKPPTLNLIQRLSVLFEIGRVTYAIAIKNRNLKSKMVFEIFMA